MAEIDPFVRVVWRDALETGLDGCGWPLEQLAAPYDRLPANARGKVTDAVWNLSHESAGIGVRFATDATAVFARYSLAGDSEVASHPWTSHSQTRVASGGLDCYALDRDTWRWVGNIVPWRASPIDGAFHQSMSPLEQGLRSFHVYLPLRNAVTKLEIGVDRDAAFEPLTRGGEKPIAWYGTSIVHGMAASRPGMTHAAIMGRRLQREIINLGFAGSARSEPDLARVLAELDPCMFVLDPVPNMNAELIDERMFEFISILRTARPQTPIMLIEDRINTDSWINHERLRHHAANRDALTSVYRQCLAVGMTNLHYVPGAALLGDDNEASVDGSHPTDLGFMRQADYLEPFFRKVLAADR